MKLNYGTRPIGSRPACWRWKPPADIGAALLAEQRRRELAERGGRALRYVGLAEEQAQWTLLQQWHRGRCAVCGTPMRDTSGLVTDHDHETTLIRGLLCYSCNTIEGFGGGVLFDKYRERPPAAICGVRLAYAA